VWSANQSKRTREHRVAFSAFDPLASREASATPARSRSEAYGSLPPNEVLRSLHTIAGGRWLKLVSGIVLLGLGLTLLARPDWLAFETM